MQQLALAHCDISFVLFDIARDSKLMHTERVQDMHAAFGNIYGTSRASNLVTHHMPPEEEQCTLSLSGACDKAADTSQTAVPTIHVAGGSDRHDPPLSMQVCDFLHDAACHRSAIKACHRHDKEGLAARVLQPQAHRKLGCA